MLDRLPGESDLQYHKRLVYAKLVDKTMADVDYAELAPYIYGQEYSSDFARRMMYGSCRTLQLMDEENEGRIVDDGLLNELEMKKIELRKEQQKFFDQRAAFNQAVREQARREELREIFERIVSDGNLPKLEYEPFDTFESDNSLIVNLSDIHYGAQHSNYWSVYNSDICGHMFEKYIDAIAHIAATHKSQDCYVVCNGDAISGFIHNSIRITNKENVIEQITGVSELIAQFLSELSVYFNRVYFTSVAGNHSRIEKKEDALISERLDDLIEWYLKARMAAFQNVQIGYGEKIDPTMYLINVRGYNFLGVHGDFEPSISNVTNLQAMVGKPLYGVLMGHRHHCETSVVQGVRVIQSGSFLGTDNYCISKRLFGKPEQIVCVVDDNGIRCYYDVDLSIDTTAKE